MVLKFRLRAPFAFFKKPYTKTSADVYLFPPKTTLIGIIAAIKGWKRDSYDEYIENTLVGIELNRIPHKVQFSLNFENTKEGKEGIDRVQMAGYVLRNVDYNVYITDESLYDDLKNLRPIYTPYLGSSNMITNIENVEIIDIKVKEKENYNTKSVVILNNENAKIIPENNSLIVEDTQPYKFENQKNGRVAIFKKFIYSNKGMVIENNPTKVIEIDNRNVVVY